MLLGLFMTGMFAATATELTELKPVRRGFLVLGRYVVAALTVVTLEHNVVAWHLFLSGRPLQLAKGRLTRFLIPIGNRQLEIGDLPYSTTSLIVPAPTVRPPSRMANRSPFSIAIGVINSTSIATLSPGITISTPCGSVATPVTSVVRK